MLGNALHVHQDLSLRPHNAPQCVLRGSLFLGNHCLSGICSPCAEAVKHMLFNAPQQQLEYAQMPRQFPESSALPTTVSDPIYFLARRIIRSVVRDYIVNNHNLVLLTNTSSAYTAVSQHIIRG